MGNQGTAADGFRRGVEVIRSGVLGAVKEIHVWTNRPIWPQGVARPKDTPASPTTSTGTSGSARPRTAPTAGPITRSPGEGWLDFGTGALGDMACHTINVAAMALESLRPRDVEVVETSGIVDRETYPSWSIIKTHFGRPAQRPSPARPDLVRRRRQAAQGEEVRDQGHAPRREDGPAAACSWSARRARSTPPVNDYGAEHCPLAQGASSKGPAPRRGQSLPHSPGHFTEWVEAIKPRATRAKALSNFDYASRLTETVLLGVVALKAGGKIEWDPAGMKVKNKPDADQYLKREYRKGFSVHAIRLNRVDLGRRAEGCRYRRRLEGSPRRRRSPA